MLHRIVSNTAISLCGQAITWTSTIALTIAYGRFLGDEKFGELYFALSLVLLIGFPLEFGFNRQITRDVAQDHSRASYYLYNTLIIKFCIWVVIYGALLSFCWLAHYSAEELTLVSLCGLTLLGWAIANTFSALYYAFERVAFPVLGSILEKGLTAGIGFVMLRGGAGVQTMAVVLLGGALVNAGWQALWLPRLIRGRLTIKLSAMRELIRVSLPFLIYGAIGVIYYRIDTVLLSLMEDLTVVGWYGAAYRLFDTLVFLPSLLIAPILLPVFSKLNESSEETLRVAIGKAANLLILTGLPTSSALIAAAPNIIAFLYGRSGFHNTIPVLQALAPGLCFLYLNSLLAAILIGIRQEKRIPILAGIALLFNLALNLILIPLYQGVGAAIVTTLTELVLLGVSMAFLPKHLLPLESVFVGVKALVASLVMVGAILLLRNQSILVILPVAAVAYLAVTMLLRTVPREDMHALYGAVRSRRSLSPAG